MLNQLYSVVPSIPHSIYPYVGFIAIIIGLILAFVGEELWRPLTTLIGAVLGGVIGLSFGTLIAGLLGGLLVGFIGALIGAILFYYIAEAGISLLIAYFTMIFVLYLFGVSGGVFSSRSQGATFPFAVALIVSIVVFIICIIYFKDLVAVFTSIAGGLLVDYGLVDIRFGQYATEISFAVVVIGIISQFIRISRKKRMIMQATRREPPATTQTSTEEGNA